MPNPQARITNKVTTGMYVNLARLRQYADLSVYEDEGLSK